MLRDELHFYLFEGKSHLLAEPMTTWLASSRRFVTFVSTFRDKIRKKLRVLPDQESLLDLRFELETAYRLLQEKMLSLIYEPFQAKTTRTADFAVTFTTSQTFMLEVTRLRTGDKGNERNPQALFAGLPFAERLADTIGSKLGQFAPQRSNVLLIGVEDANFAAHDLQQVMHRIRTRVEANDTAFLLRHHFRDRADFFNHFQRMSEILVRSTQVEGGELNTGDALHFQKDEQPIMWVNPQAKQPLPSKVRTALYRSQAG